MNLSPHECSQGIEIPNLPVNADGSSSFSKNLTIRFQQCLEKLHQTPFYEKRSHTSTPDISSLYDIVVAIPTAQKVILWFTMVDNQPLCLQMNVHLRESTYMFHDILDIQCSNYAVYFDTMMYGSMYEHRIHGNVKATYFVFEDILQYEGNNTKGQWYRHKLQLFRQLVDEITYTCLPLKLPVMWYRTNEKMQIEGPPPPHIFYKVHHYQYRGTSCSIAPMLVPPGMICSHDSIQTMKTPIYHVHKQLLSNSSYSDSIQTHPTKIFEVTATLQNDWYYLHADNHQEMAYIPDYKTSVMMNDLFRTIKENHNLHAIEESDNEEEFENIREDRFVDLTKRLTMECVWNSKFQKWIPLRVLP